MRIPALLLVCTAATMVGCLNPQDVHNSVNSDDKATISVANAQRSIKVGMTGAAVAEALGSPNILSTDEEGREVWIYDRVRTEYAAGSYDLSTGLALVGADSQSDNQFGVAVRCNVTKEIDVTVGYAWVDGDGAFSLSAGYNF